MLEEREKQRRQPRRKLLAPLRGAASQALRRGGVRDLIDQLRPIGGMWEPHEIRKQHHEFIKHLRHAYEIEEAPHAVCRALVLTGQQPYPWRVVAREPERHARAAAGYIHPEAKRRPEVDKVRMPRQLLQ